MSRKKASQARKDALKEYRKQRRRIGDIIKRAQAAGERVDLKQPEPIAAKSNILTVTIKAITRKLAELTPRKLRAAGKLEKHERKQAKPETLRTPVDEAEILRQQDHDHYDDDDRNNEYFDEWIFQQEQKERDRENRERLEQDREYRETFSEGKIIYNRIQGMIDEAAVTHPKVAAELRKLLNEEMAQYGQEQVIWSLAQAGDDAIESATTALSYGKGDSRHESAIYSLRQIITGGEIPTAAEAAIFQEAIDSDAQYENP